MSEIIIYSSYGEITAQAMTCVDITKSILASEAERSETEEQGDRLPEEF